MTSHLDNLTKKQSEILDYIVAFIRDNGYPPAYREIASGLGISSPATVCEHVTNLKRKGFLTADGGARSLEVEPSVLSSIKAVALPLKGLITAGEPIEAIESNETFSVPSSMVVHPDKTYALKVRGNSMIDDGILSGDYVIIEENPSPRDGEIVVALIDQTYATLKRIYREKGRFRLQPANRTMSPIFASDVQVQGVVKGLFRSFSSL